jgi:hypothetical protein
MVARPSAITRPFQVNNEAADIIRFTPELAGRARSIAAERGPVWAIIVKVPALLIQLNAHNSGCV